MKRCDAKYNVHKPIIKPKPVIPCKRTCSPEDVLNKKCKICKPFKPFKPAVIPKTKEESN